jgi:hypothetical protein
MRLATIEARATQGCGELAPDNWTAKLWVVDQVVALKNIAEAEFT